MDGIELNARLSFVTNQLRFCGPQGATTTFLTYIRDHKDKQKSKGLIDRFEGVPPYLHLIADKHGLDPFDAKVAEAYWIGNELLDGFSDDDMRRLIDMLVSRGLPKSLGSALKDKLPPGMMPHHNFNVLFVGVGALTGSVETTLPNMDNCRISWGRVAEVMKAALLLSARPLKEVDGRIVVGEEETRTAVYIPEMLPDVKVGDAVALHWGFSPMLLSADQAVMLDRYTDRILDALEKASKKK
ncbi:MAG: DUF6390 family protein [archaeon]